MPEEFDRRRILVVDDEERMVRFIRMNLEHDGFQVAEAFNGKQAIQKLRDVTPDLILLDVMMPAMDGPTTFLQLQKNPSTAKIPVILLTAKVQGSDQRRFAELGVAGILFKPFDPLTLSTQVSQTLGWNQIH